MAKTDLRSLARLVMMLGALGCAGCKPPTSPSDDAGACAGNATVWSTLTTDPIACTSDSDCCVIMNECQESEHVVACATASQASAAWPAAHCSDGMPDCLGCIGPPAIEPRCIDGACTGVPVSTDGGAEDAGVADDAGTAVDAGVAPTSQSALHFGCGP